MPEADRRPASRRLIDGVLFEWTKLVTLRSHVATLAGLGVALPAFAVIVAVTGSLQPDDTVLGASVLAGAATALVIAVALGVVSMTGEHRTGMLRVTLTARPERWVVLAAKAAVVGTLVFVVGLASASAAFALGVALLPDTHAPGEPFPALLGVAGLVAAAAVLGIAIGTMVRDSAPAVGLGVALVLMPVIVAPLAGDLARWVGGASLVGVMQKLTQSSDATVERVGSWGAWPSFALLLVCTGTALAVARWVLDRRDA